MGRTHRANNGTRKQLPPRGSETSTTEQPAEPGDRIRVRAYEIYRSRNGAAGDAVSDWLQAEREVTSSSPESDELPEHEIKCLRRNEQEPYGAPSAGRPESLLRSED